MTLQTREKVYNPEILTFNKIIVSIILQMMENDISFV